MSEFVKNIMTIVTMKTYKLLTSKWKESCIDSCKMYTTINQQVRIIASVIEHLYLSCVVFYIANSFTSMSCNATKMLFLPLVLYRIIWIRKIKAINASFCRCNWMDMLPGCSHLIQATITCNHMLLSGLSCYNSNGIVRLNCQCDEPSKFRNCILLNFFCSFLIWKNQTISRSTSL